MLMSGEAFAIKLLPGKTEPTRVFEYKAGQYFGERALLTNEPRAASIITKSPCKCLTLDRGSFVKLLGNLRDLLRQNMDQYI